MKYLFLLVTVFLLAMNTKAQTWAGSKSASTFTGQTVNMVGYVSGVDAKKLASTWYDLITLNIPGNSTPVIVLLPRQYQRKLNDVSTYLDNYVHVKGNLQVKNGNPYLLLQTTKQISVVPEAPNTNDWEPL